MDYIPQADWKWIYDFQHGKLSVSIRKQSFPLVYQPNVLRLNESQSISFTIEDVTRYIQLFEGQELSRFEESLRCKIILHLLAVDLFHKPIMPKSWLFQQTTAYQAQYRHGDIVTLIASGSEKAAKYMVLEQEGAFCLCMLFDESHLLENNRTFKQFQLIKVSVDNMIAPETVEDQAHEWISFQNAG